MKRLVSVWVIASGLLLTWPAGAQNIPAGPPIVYVSNAGGGITEVNSANNSVIATAPFANNANSVAVTPDGRQMYVSNRDASFVTVFNTATNVPQNFIPVGNGALDNLGLAVSPDGQLVYVANQVSGTVTVIATATNRVIQTIPTGLQPIWVTFSADSSRAYVSNQLSGTISVIATASGSVTNTFGSFSCPYYTKLTLDGSKLLVSSQCDNTLKVVDLATNAVINSIPTGPMPRGIALTPDGKRAYVTNWLGNTVDVIDVAAQVNLSTPIVVGSQPWGIAMTPGGKAYVANFGDGTISVIDSATNTVTATLRARVFPEDLTLSITAEPRILNYSFLAFDPPGSVDTIPEAVNNRGQIVGTFQDTGGVQHGFLRQPNASLVAIDPPGSVFTEAFGINDEGVIVGLWQASSGGVHGFTLSPSGLYTTVDLPGATDSALTGINDLGNITGGYDLGDQTTSIGFLDVRGQFTSFEDPAAAPMQTQTYGINSLNFISGLYFDPAANPHGFVRQPDATFHNYDFPGADQTLGRDINDFGCVAGQYFTNFPSHGFVLSGGMMASEFGLSAEFLSFDYPDSQATALRGINNVGLLSGFFRLHGETGRHGFLAMLSAVNSQ